MAGILYLVATPIGNLGDFSPRAAETLAQADFIAAEDTRVSVKLLNHFDIKKPLVSYHEHNRAAAGQAILERLLSGETCALVTDAGTPAISDPGQELVALCAENGVTVQAIPGCCAAIAALAVSGLDTRRFTFEGFLPSGKKERRAALEELTGEARTMVFHEAPHRLRQSLADLVELLGDRPAALCRELTKLHEDTVRTTLAQAAAFYRDNEPRGEYVLVVAGREKQNGPDAGRGRSTGAGPAGRRYEAERGRASGSGRHRPAPQRPVRYRAESIRRKKQCRPSGRHCFFLFSGLLQLAPALGADILAAERGYILVAVAEHTAHMGTAQHDAVALHADLHCLALADIQRAAHFDRDHDPAKLVDAADNTGRFHVLSPSMQ